MHKAKDKGHRAHGRKEIMHAYGPNSTPIAQGLVEDINAMHTYGRSSAPIAQGLVYDINAPHAFGLRESKRTYGSVSIPIAQGLVAIINAKDQKMVMSPKAQGHVKKKNKNFGISEGEHACDMLRSEQAGTPSLHEAHGANTQCCSTCTIHAYITAHTHTHTHG